MRFPGFESGWEALKLGDISERLTKKNKENNQNVLTISAQYGLINQMKFFTKSVSSKDLTGYYILEKGDFAYNKSYSNGYPMGAIKHLVNYNKGIVSTLYICFRFSNEVDKSFAQQFFESGKQNVEIEKIAQEGARNHGLLNIGVNDFFNIKLNFPILNEQRKIASFLCLLDKRIQTQKKIIEDTCKMKLKLSHNLFTQNFRINRQYISKWKEKTLGDISAILMGQSPDSSAYNTDEKGLPLIQGNADIVQRFSQPRQFTSQITKTCNIGDIILTVRAPVGYVAKSKHFACIGRGVCAIKSNEKSDSEFIYQFLLYFENKWSSFEQGSTFTSVNSSDIKSIKINVPTIEVQREIAQFLKIFDEKINIETELLIQYENQKKYLLQNLFI